MLTFSTPPTEANQLSGIVNVLNILPDNTAKQISPKDVRDAVYTLWENTILKPTSVSGSTVKYIGVDQYQLKNDSDASIYPKMYFGKKQAGGQFIMSDDLLNNLVDTDFFFYNMKDNSTVGDYHTTIAILAGTGSFTNYNGVAAPTLKSTVVSDALGSYIDFNITNNSFVTDGTTESGGNINIRSNKGYVSINDFIFPKVSDITAANNDYVLKYRWIAGNAYGVWESAFSQSITEINYPQGQVTITGNPIVLNGYNFTDDNIVATAIGGILAGETFSNVDVLDMLRRIIYTYVPPIITTNISLTSTPNTPLSLIEMSESLSNVRLYYSLTINSTYSVTQNLSISTSDGGTSPVGGFPPTPIMRGSYDGTVTLTPDVSLINTPYKIISYTFSVTDSYPTTKTSNSKLTVVLPYFYGTSDTLYTNGIGINNILGTNSSAPLGKLNLKLVDPIIGSPTLLNNQSVIITTQGLPSNQGYIYFGYPSQFPLLKQIIDHNGFTFSDTDFTTYSVSISSANSRWGGKDYIFYIRPNITTVPITSTPYQFIFATQS